MDTIFALASAPGKAGVSVIRISGPKSFEVVEKVGKKQVSGRDMTLVHLRDAESRIIDQALVLTFCGPASFTGEDVCEFHVHGSSAVVATVLKTLRSLDGLRMAEPGEFTRRALENGKLDLAQVEGLADLIDAETEAQRRQAHQLFVGSLGKKVEIWRKNLIRAASLLEATIDFADEDVPVDVTPEVSELLDAVASDLLCEVKGVSIAERIRAGFEIAIVGPPNVGKSTLLNALAGREAAITSEYEGTTRDVIEVRMDLDGFPVTVLDTAGVREASDIVEKIGVSKTRERAELADLRVFLSEDPSDLGVIVQEDDLHFLPKADLRESSAGAISGVTGEGIDHLVRSISEILFQKSASVGLATRERHKDAMEQALTALQRAESSLSAGSLQYDMAAEDLRAAIRALEMLVGRIDVETLLDEVFSSFCIGK